MWLIIGGDSEIGAATYHQLRAKGQSVIASTRRAEREAADMPLLDLSSALDDWEPPSDVRAACVFAAVARLAACQANPFESAHINVTQTVALIDRLTARGIYVLFLSTNQVFDGETSHVPANAPTCPVSEYGRQKARTEAALCKHMARGAPVGILRLAKVIAPGTGLIRSWIEALSSGKPIRAFYDMTMAPTPIGIVVAAISCLMSEQARGIFQLTGPVDVSYVDVGYHLAQRLGVGNALVQSVSARSARMPVGAAPRHTTLDSAHLRNRYGLAVPNHWTAIYGIIGEVDGIISEENANAE
jgi:dTDP-4-dehydrorhamnose reductase